MQMWVFRLPTGPGGDPSGSCDPNEIDREELELNLENADQRCLTSYENCLDFAIQEVFKKGNLRQGWGIPTLDLRLPEEVWNIKYILAAKKYWGEDIGCDAAKGRRNILRHMLNMKKGDVIFLPTITKDGKSNSNFTVVTVVNSYFFEDRSQEEIKDFAHVIKVNRQRTFPYPIDDISDGFFGTPFRRAVSSVKEDYANDVHAKLLKFIAKHYQ